ncbi:MAG: Galactose-1-phosphate uridylyltransferase [Acidobacteria bacterium]|nr:Galactose-1-phosphate uridylyltransferase [Acidobacteriota bacterium]
MNLRPHPITHELVLHAPERAQRPHAFAGLATAGAAEIAVGGPLTRMDEPCPFCAGNESLTPPELARRGPRENWRIRVFPNKYPATEHHEIIVESPRHEASFEQLADPAEAVRVYIERYETMRRNADVRYVSLFRNHGPMAGASLQHLHSQMIGLTFVPPRVETESYAFLSWKSCRLCDAIAAHRALGLIIEETESMVWLAPSAPTFAYQTWLLPKRHLPEMTRLDELEIVELAMLLTRASQAIGRLATSCNWLWMNFPDAEQAHLYVDLVPRLTAVAGFELATGTFINVIDPAETLRVMKR